MNQIKIFSFLPLFALALIPNFQSQAQADEPPAIRCKLDPASYFKAGFDDGHGLPLREEELTQEQRARFELVLLIKYSSNPEVSADAQLVVRGLRREQKSSTGSVEFKEKITRYKRVQFSGTPDVRGSLYLMYQPYSSGHTKTGAFQVEVAGDGKATIHVYGHPEDDHHERIALGWCGVDYDQFLMPEAEPEEWSSLGNLRVMPQMIHLPFSPTDSSTKEWFAKIGTKKMMKDVQDLENLLYSKSGIGQFSNTFINEAKPVDSQGNSSRYLRQHFAPMVDPKKYCGTSLKNLFEQSLVAKAGDQWTVVYAPNGDPAGIVLSLTCDKVIESVLNVKKDDGSWVSQSTLLPVRLPMLGWSLKSGQLLPKLLGDRVPVFN